LAIAEKRDRAEHQVARTISGFHRSASISDARAIGQYWR
jgi:hypothetical protein